MSWRDPDHLTDDDMADDASITDDDGEFGDVSSLSVNAGGAYYTAGLMMITSLVPVSFFFSSHFHYPFPTFVVPPITPLVVDLVFLRLSWFGVAIRVFNFV